MNNTSISVGLPFLKCSSNPSQTINKKTNKKSKTGTTRLVCQENIERIGRDPDIDHEKSKYNKFLTDITSTKEYIDLIENTKKEINQKLKEYGKRQLRKDTVDNISLIVKPNIEALQQFTIEEKHKFFKDSKQTIEKIWNIDISVAVEHYDEDNPHLHINFMPLINNELNFKTFNAKKFLSLPNITKLNREYSKEMQKLGWNVQDMNIYEDMNDEERQQYKEIKKEYGKSSLQFKAEKRNKLEKEINKLKEEKQQINENISEITDKYKTILNENEKLNKENKQKKEYKKILEEESSFLEKQYTSTNNKLQENIAKLEQQKNTDLYKQQQETIKNQQDTINFLTEEVSTLKWYQKAYKLIIKAMAKIFRFTKSFEPKETVENIISKISKEDEDGESYQKFIAKDVQENINKLGESEEVEYE